MTTTGVEGFDRTVHKTNVWLKEIMEELGWEDRQRAYLALRAALHALRDRLTVVEAAELGAQLPMLIRGLYYEGWHPAGKPLKERHKEEFLSHIGEHLRLDFAGEAEAIARAVFTVLDRNVTGGEMADVRGILPHEIRELLPQPAGGNLLRPSCR